MLTLKNHVDLTSFGRHDFSRVNNSLCLPLCNLTFVYNAVDIDCLQQLFVKAKRWQIVSDNYDVPQLFDNSDLALLKSLLNVDHRLRRLYPPKRHHVNRMTLRPCGPNVSLPKCRLHCDRNSFLDRKLLAV